MLPIPTYSVPLRDESTVVRRYALFKEEPGTTIFLGTRWDSIDGKWFVFRNTHYQYFVFQNGKAEPFLNYIFQGWNQAVDALEMYLQQEARLEIERAISELPPTVPKMIKQIFL